MTIEERAKRMVDFMLQNQNDFITDSNKQQEQLSIAMKDSIKEVLKSMEELK